MDIWFNFIPPTVTPPVLPPYNPQIFSNHAPIRRYAKQGVEADVVNGLVGIVHEYFEAHGIMSNDLHPKSILISKKECKVKHLMVGSGESWIFEVEGFDNLVFKVRKESFSVGKHPRNFVREAGNMDLVANHLVEGVKGKKVDGFSLQKIPGFAAVLYLKSLDIEGGVVVQQRGDQSLVADEDVKYVSAFMKQKKVHVENKKRNIVVIADENENREAVMIDNASVEISPLITQMYPEKFIHWNI